MGAVVRTLENNGKIDQYVYDVRGDLRLVPPGHIYEETASGQISIRPIGVSRRFFEASGGVGGETSDVTEMPEEEQAPEGPPEETEEVHEEKDQNEEPAQEKGVVHQRNVRELLPLISAAETLAGLEALREKNEDRATVIRALLKKRRELLAGSKG